MGSSARGQDHSERHGQRRWSPKHWGSSSANGRKKNKQTEKTKRLRAEIEEERGPEGYPPKSGRAVATDPTKKLKEHMLKHRNVGRTKPRAHNGSRRGKAKIPRNNTEQGKTVGGNFIVWEYGKRIGNSCEKRERTGKIGHPKRT